MKAKSLLIFAILAGGIIVAGFRIYSSSEQSKDRAGAEFLARVMAMAAATGNHVVNARAAVEAPGGLTVLDGRATLPLARGQPPIRLQDVAVCIVFVHGYNNSFATAIDEGNILWASIRSQLDNEGSARIRFFSFCWRGDFGVLRFDASNDSALHTAPALAGFLETLAGDPASVGPRKIIVVTHSLGALLALQALHTLEPAFKRPLVDTLLMIQPAVKIDLLGRATIRQVYNVPRAGRTNPDLPEFEVLPSYQNHGVYFDTVATMTRQTLATASNADSVLTWAFDGVWAKGPQGARIITQPINRIALGTLIRNESLGWTFPPNLEVFDLTPDPKRPAGVGGHSDVFDPGHPALRRFLFEEISRR